MINQNRYSIEIEATPEGYQAKIGDKTYQVILKNDTDKQFELELDGQKMGRTFSKFQAQELAKSKSLLQNHDPNKFHQTLHYNKLLLHSLSQEINNLL